MPYSLEWLNAPRRIAAVRLIDPIADDEARRLQDDVLPLLDGAQPVFLLADIRDFNPMEALTRLSGLLDKARLPKLTDDHVQQSRVAILGGGPMVRMALSLAKGMTGDDMIRPFSNEDRAVAWLEEQSPLP